MKLSWTKIFIGFFFLIILGKLLWLFFGNLILASLIEILLVVLYFSLILPYFQTKRLREFCKNFANKEVRGKRSDFRNEVVFFDNRAIVVNVSVSINGISLYRPLFIDWFIPWKNISYVERKRFEGQEIAVIHALSGSISSNSLTIPWNSSYNKLLPLEVGLK